MKKESSGHICGDNMIKSKELPISYCPLCSSFVIESKGQSISEHLYSVLRNIHDISGDDAILRTSIIPLLVGLCKNQYSPILHILFKLSESDLSNRLLMDIKSSSGLWNESDIERWADLICATLGTEYADAYYLIKTIAFACYKCNDIEDYDISQDNSTSNKEEKTDKLYINVEPSIVQRGGQIKVEWSSDFSKKRKQKKYNKYSYTLLALNQETGEKKSISIRSNGNLILYPTNNTLYTIICKNRAGSTYKVSSLVTVLDELAIKKFFASPQTILEGESSTLVWSVDGFTSLKLKIDEFTGVSKTIDVSNQPDSRYVISPQRKVQLTLIAEGVGMSRIQAMTEIGVRRLPRFPVSQLPKLSPISIVVNTPDLSKINSFSADYHVSSKRSRLLSLFNIIFNLFKI